MEELDLDPAHVREAAHVLGTTTSSRSATLGLVQWQPAGVRGAAGVGALPHVPEVDRPGSDCVRMEIHVLEPPHNFVIATNRHVQVCI